MPMFAWKAKLSDWTDRTKLIEAIIRGRYAEEPLQESMNQTFPIGGWLVPHDPVRSLARYEASMASGRARRGAGR